MRIDRKEGQGSQARMTVWSGAVGRILRVRYPVTLCIIHTFMNGWKNSPRRIALCLPTSFHTHVSYLFSLSRTTSTKRRRQAGCAK